MNNKQLMIGVVACFVVTILFVALIMWEVGKARKYDEKMQKLAANSKSVVATDNRDFSVYETLTGDDGREMILVPEGVFTRGSDHGGIDEKPQKEIYLDAFYVDKYEVTVKDYEVFRKAARYAAPSVPFFQGDQKILETPDFPVTGVSWLDATNYCVWAGKRLLTEAEWEKAARGAHGLDYPWGNEFQEKRANIAGDADGFTYMSPAGAFPMGRSAYGVYDMTGNVAEWVADWYEQFYYEAAPMMNPTGPTDQEDKKNRVYRGGSWDSRKVEATASKRFAATPGRKDSIIGFRCGRSKNAAAP